MTEPCGPAPLTGGFSKAAEPVQFKLGALVAGCGLGEGADVGVDVGDAEGDGDASGVGAADGATLVKVLSGTVEEHPASANPARSTAGKLTLFKD